MEVQDALDTREHRNGGRGEGFEPTGAPIDNESHDRLERANLVVPERLGERKDKGGGERDLCEERRPVGEAREQPLEAAQEAL